MKYRLAALTALAAVALTGGCGVLQSADAAPASAAPVATGGSGSVKDSASTSPVATSGSGSGSVKDSGDIPDPCTLLSRTEATDLTGRQVTQIDEDGADAGDATRFCQWQQDGGQLAVFLSRTTAADFQSAVAGAEPVDSVGEDAFWFSGHLYVLTGTVQIDVYSRGGEDQVNLDDARQVAEVLLARV